MEIVTGRRYRLIRDDGLPNRDGVADVDEFGSPTFRADDLSGVFMVEPKGVVFGIGRLVAIEAAPAMLRPTFGSDADELARLRRVFAVWDFSYGAVG